MSTPAARKLSVSSQEYLSSPPSLVSSAVFAPSLAEATAWLAPLPPAATRKELPGTVSPSAGMRST